MNDTEPAALLQAIRLVAPFAGTHAVTVLRRALGELVSGHDRQDAHPADTTTPPAQGVTDGAVRALDQCGSPDAGSPSHAERTMRPASASKPTRTRPGKANGKTTGPAPAAEWLHLRKQVRAEMARLQLDMAGLAAALGRKVSTVTNVMTKCSAPSTVIADLLREFLLAGPGTPAVAATEAAATPPTHSAPVRVPTPSAAVQAARNGDDLHVGEPLAEDALKALKRKRHATPLTSHTLASQLGLEAGQLSRALAGEAVSAAAAERLAAWTAG